MTEIKGFTPAKIGEQSQNKNQQSKPSKTMKDDFNSALIKNLEHLKSIENKIDDLATDSDNKTASSLDMNVKNAGVILKDIEGIWENLKEKEQKNES